MCPNMREGNIFRTQANDFDLDKTHQLRYYCVTYRRRLGGGEVTFVVETYFSI
jgi:hypothetical protein